MAKVSLKRQRLEFAKAMDEKLKKLASQQIVVGVWKEEVSEYAVYNEYGTAYIPARPFFRTATSFEESRNIIANYTRQAIESLISGQLTVEQVQAKIGLYLKGRVINSVRNGGWTMNSQATIDRKGNKPPLIDSGDLISSIEWEVKDNG